MCSSLIYEFAGILQINLSKISWIMGRVRVKENRIEALGAFLSDEAIASQMEN
jgi:hypothetical protein